MNCPECGAPQTPDDSCRDRYEHCLALELSDWDYGAVHHLTVSTYNLQHPTTLSAAGWHTTRALLDRFLNDGVSPAEMRVQLRRSVDSGQRDWSLTGGEPLTLPAEFNWQQTIPPVQDGRPEAYCRVIIAWARSVLDDACILEAR